MKVVLIVVAVVFPVSCSRDYVPMPTSPTPSVAAARIVSTTTTASTPSDPALQARIATNHIWGMVFPGKSAVCLPGAQVLILKGHLSLAPS
jgi:hypothetical protein